MHHASMTLREWFGTFQTVFLAGAKPRTLKEYGFSIAKWDALSQNPPLEAIDTLAMAEFQSKLAAIPLARPTVNKHLRHVQHLLNKAGPPGPHNRDALGIVPRAAWVKPLKTLKHAPAYLKPSLLNALYESARAATKPIYDNDRIEPAVWWQTLIVLAYNLGLRRGALMQLEWVNIEFDTRLLRVPAHIDKSGVERIKPLNGVCLRHLMKIRSRAARVFHWPLSESQWYRNWRPIAGAAAEHSYKKMVQHSFDFTTDIVANPPAEPNDSGSTIRCLPQVIPRAVPRFHDLKRTSATVWANHASPWAVRYMLDHGASDVTGLYVNPEGELREKCESLPQPSAFLGDGEQDVLSFERAK